MCSPWRDSFVWDITHLRRDPPPAAHCDMIWLVHTVTWRMCSLCHDSFVWDMTHLRRDPPRVAYCDVTPSYVTWPRANLVTVGADTWVTLHMSLKNDSCLVFLFECDLWVMCHSYTSDLDVSLSHMMSHMSHTNKTRLIYHIYETSYVTEIHLDQMYMNDPWLICKTRLIYHI